MIKDHLLAKILHDFSSPITSMSLMYEMGSTDVRTLQQSIQSLVLRVNFYRQLLLNHELHAEEVVHLLQDICNLFRINFSYKLWPDDVTTNKLVLGLIYLICERVDSGELVISYEDKKITITHPDFGEAKSKELFEYLTTLGDVQPIIRGFSIVL